MNLCRGLIVAVLFIASSARAATDPRDAQIEAAAGDAVTRLRADIEVQILSPGLSVADFLHWTSSTDRLVAALRSADQIGGPRWIDTETCQVKLAIGSDRVRDALVEIATTSGRQSPLPPDALAAKLRVWEGRTFTATGTSISAQRAQQLRPADFPGPWRGISDDVRTRAIISARDNAIDRVLDSIGSINVAESKTVSQMLEEKHARDAMRQWLAGRPVTRLEFRPDLSVEITLAVTGRNVYDDFCELAGGRDAISSDSLKLAKLRQGFEQSTAPAIGAARAAGQGNHNATIMARISRQPPAWLSQSLTSEATQKNQGSRLKTCRIAENAARDSLRGKIDALELPPTTIGDAAKQNADVERAVQQALDRARTYKTDYLPDGSATVKVSLDPRDLWDQLRELP